MLSCVPGAIRTLNFLRLQIIILASLHHTPSSLFIDRLEILTWGLLDLDIRYQLLLRASVYQAFGLLRLFKIDASVSNHWQLATLVWFNLHLLLLTRRIIYCLWIHNDLWMLQIFHYIHIRLIFPVSDCASSIIVLIA